MKPELIEADSGGGVYKYHTSSFVDEGASIGKDTVIWHFTHVMKGAVIGEKCSIGQNVFVASKAVIGSNVKIQNNVSVYDRVILEDDVFCGPSVVFTNVINPRSFIERKTEYRETVIKKGASIGANATIVCGVSLGKFAFIGAGSVVTKNIPDYALAVGIPAKITGWVCECGNKLDQNHTCAGCKKKYYLNGNNMTHIK